MQHNNILVRCPSGVYTISFENSNSDTNNTEHIPVINLNNCNNNNFKTVIGLSLFLLTTIPGSTPIVMNSSPQIQMEPISSQQINSGMRVLMPGYSTVKLNAGQAEPISVRERVNTSNKTGKNVQSEHFSLTAAYNNVYISSFSPPSEEKGEKTMLTNRHFPQVNFVYGTLAILGMFVAGASAFSAFVSPFLDPNIARVSLPMSGAYLSMLLIDYYLRGKEHA